MIALAVAGCDAPDAPVAEVGAWRLDGDRLADLLVLAQPLPLDSATATGLVREWMGRAAGMQRVLRGDDLFGGSALAASIWLEEREALLDAARRTREIDTLSVSEVRKEFDADSLRLFAHVLRAVDPSTSPVEIDLQRRTAQEILDGLLRGDPWPDAVVRSEDVLTRDDLGVLGLLRIDELPPSLQDVAFRLRAGQVSAVVPSPAGFHILYRPTFDDAWTRYRSLLDARRYEAWDRAANRSVRDSLDFVLSDGALGRARALLHATPVLAADPTPLVRWTGGVLDGSVLRSYLAALAPQGRTSLETAPDDALADFLRELAAREHRVGDARREGIRADSATLADLEALHRAEVGRWLAALPTEGGSEAARNVLARSMEDLVSRRSTVPPLGPLLQAWMMEPWDPHLDGDALEAAVEKARALVAAAAGGP